ncbi:hypothetical protein Pint_04811 [Pistacia integerrima]|uniref:Uncharacterized protein n=1 Tax=Pistacia integerrima TaxID=434235 RepID=A0ACC0Z7J4_9ROSI|nr:hypothetical protein Pint_04811 [Pistacia integerrima]
MDQAEICEIHHVVSGEESLNCRNNVNSLVLYDVLKSFLLKYAMDGADKVFKDQKLRKTNSPGNVLEKGSNLPDNYQAFPVEYARNRKRNQVNHSLQEKERVVCTNLDNKVLESRKDRLYGTNSRHVRGCLMRKLMRMLGVSSEIVTVKAKKSMVHVAMRFLVEKPFQATEILNFDYTKSSPVAFVPIMSYPGIDNPSSLIVNDNIKAAKDASSPAIPYGHKLQLTVSLTLPESEYNRKLGVFQVRVEFLSANGKVTASSSNPCMLQFKSQPIHFVQTILKSAPLIAGFQSESQILNIKMNEFREGIEPTARLKVILEQRAEYKSGAGIPEIYAASLAVESRLPQLKRIIWYWRRTIFVWASFMMFLVELVIVLVFCRTMIIPRGRTKIVHDKKGSPLSTISWYKSG